MDLSIIIPAYNEADHIAQTLQEIQTFLQKQNWQDRAEVIVVTDGSQDNTPQILKDFNWIKLVSYSENQGKGYALQQGLKVAEGEYVYFCDADLAVSINALSEFWELRREHDAVVGVLAPAAMEKRLGFLRRILNWVGTKIVNLALDLELRFAQSGFKLLSRKAAMQIMDLQTLRWGSDFELLYLLKQSKFKIHQLPVAWSAKKEHTNFRWYHNFITAMEILKIWWHYVRFSPPFWRGLWRQYGRLIKYVIVGVMTNVLKFGIFAFLIKTNFFADLPINFGLAGVFTISTVIFGYQLAETMAQVLSVVCNYFAHKYWTFGAKEQNAGELLRYLSLITFNYFVSLILLTFGIQYLGLSELWAQLITILLVVSWNFIIMKFLIYRVS